MAEVRSRKDRPTGSIHFGDTDFDVPDDFGDATWTEVYQACCVHTAGEWAYLALGLLFVFTFLYFFLLGLELLGSGAKVMSGCKAGSLFGDDTNPIAGLMVGIISTVMLQSSSTTTSIIVSLVGSVITVSQGIYMVMGANIGTTVTNTIVAIGQMGDGDQLERAFAGATVHDMFNFMTVAVLLPLEWATGYLRHLTAALTKNAKTSKGEDWEGPIKKIVAPLSDNIIKSNSKLTKAIAQGKGSCDEGGGFYPIVCTSDPPRYSTCTTVGLISCIQDGDKCPAFFQVDATAHDDQVSGGVVFFISICLLFFCLGGLVTILQRMLLGMSTRIIYKATNINGYLAIAIGCGVTLLVQSSSITTSTLTPLVGIGALRLEQMYPLTLGANIGTTFTGLMAAMVSDSIKSLQVALAHLFFNITGIAIYYPIPFMRNIILHFARQLGAATRLWRGFPFLYIGVLFLLLPMMFLGISFLFEDGAKGYTVLGCFIVIILALIIGWTTYYCNYRGGRESCVKCMQVRERRRVVMQDLPDDMDYLKARIAALLEHTGLPDEDEVPDNDETKEGGNSEVGA